MKKTNEQIARCWANGNSYEDKWSNLSTDGKRLISYSTCIAINIGPFCLMTRAGFSPTTRTRHLPHARRHYKGRIIFTDGPFAFGASLSSLSDERAIQDAYHDLKHHLTMLIGKRNRARSNKGWWQRAIDQTWEEINILRDWLLAHGVNVLADGLGPFTQEIRRAA